MDMTLYALLMKELEGQESFSSWNGFKIEVVDEWPDIPTANTIYLVKSKVMVVEYYGYDIIFFT